MGTSQIGRGERNVGVLEGLGRGEVELESSSAVVRWSGGTKVLTDTIKQRP